MSGGRRGALLLGGSAAAALAGLPAAAPLPALAEGDALPMVPRAAPLANAPRGFAPSSVIKGCWQLGGGHRGEAASDRTSGAVAVDDFAAFEAAGIASFDTGPEACGYGPSERVIGQFVASRGGAEGLQLNTKVCAGFSAQTATPQSVREAVKRAKQRMGVPSLGLVQLYWHRYGQAGLEDAALTLTDLAEAGEIAYVGTTNFDTESLARMVDAGARLDAHQIQYSLLDRRCQNGQEAYCVDNGIALLPYGVVAGGLLSDRYVGAKVNDVKVDTSSKGKYASVARQAGGWAQVQTLLAVCKKVGDKHGQSVSNVATKWVLAQPAVPAVIIGARNAKHVADHQRLFQFDLDAEDLSEIQAALDEQPRPRGEPYAWERGGSF